MKRILIYLVLTQLLTASCQKILFNEEESTKEIPLENFHAVKFYGIYNIILVQDSINRLVIIGKKDVNSIKAIIRNDILIIDDQKKMSFNPNKNTLVLHFKNLQFMTTYDPVNISNTNTLKANEFLYEALGEITEGRLTVECNSFTFVNSANTLGYLYLNGIANYCTIFNRYGSAVFADDLLCWNAEIINESIGDVHINASETIKAYILGPGNICYYGTPVIEIAEKKGKGRLIRLFESPLINPSP
jgi:hypothetical protein